MCSIRHLSLRAPVHSAKPLAQTLAPALTYLKLNTTPDPSAQSTSSISTEPEAEDSSQLDSASGNHTDREIDCQLRLLLTPDNARRLAELCGQFNQNLSQIEQRLSVRIRNRGNDFGISGQKSHAQAAEYVLRELYADTENGHITPEQVHLSLQQASSEQGADGASHAHDDTEQTNVLRTRQQLIKPRGANQKRYVHMIQRKDINFGIGPAGTGKTWLAVACAVAALEQDKVGRILLVRPAVEAGEKLGFLPGDLAQKIDPYLRPLYDALYEMLGFETVGKLIERNVIEVAPLAYMRGRTLNDSFIILDEAQNTTKAQMKMFLTRIGFGSTAVITGDLSQVDLPRDTASGLKHAIKVLERIDDIGMVQFESKDVVRHALVQRIVDAYDRFEQKESSTGNSSSYTRTKHA